MYSSSKRGAMEQCGSKEELIGLWGSKERAMWKCGHVAAKEGQYGGVVTKQWGKKVRQRAV
jgi:hypothetical protein